MKTRHQAMTILFYQINLQEVQGTGRDGRVLKEDMLRHIESMKGSKSAASSISPPPKYQAMMEQRNKTESPSKLQAPFVKQPVSCGVNRDEPIKGFKKAMVKSMTYALVICLIYYVKRIFQNIIL